MLCFLIPLKSKRVSCDWHKVSRIFESTLRSAYSQIDSDIKIIVICHEKPELQHEYDERVEIIQVDFSIPQKIVMAETMKDKWKKLTVGMIRAQELNPDFVMFLDADDLVSRKLSQYANSHKDENGWIFKTGYMYKYGSNWLDINKNFPAGSIVNSKLINFPTTMKDSDNCVVLANGHTTIEAKMKELNMPLEPLPFPGYIYVLDHGDNDSSTHFRWYGIRFFLSGLRHKRFLNKKIKQEFSLPV